MEYPDVTWFVWSLVEGSWTVETRTQTPNELGEYSPLTAYLETEGYTSENIDVNDCGEPQPPQECTKLAPCSTPTPTPPTTPTPEVPVCEISTEPLSREALVVEVGAQANEIEVRSTNCANLSLVTMTASDPGVVATVLSAGGSTTSQAPSSAIRVLVDQTNATLDQGVLTLTVTDDCETLVFTVPIASAENASNASVVAPAIATEERQTTSAAQTTSQASSQTQPANTGMTSRSLLGLTLVLAAAGSLLLLPLIRARKTNA